MNAPLRILAFILGLLVVFGASFGLGAAVGPLHQDRDGNDVEQPQHAAAMESTGAAVERALLERTRDAGPQDHSRTRVWSYVDNGRAVSQRPS